jgi:hypothetical protein
MNCIISQTERCQGKLADDCSGSACEEVAVAGRCASSNGNTVKAAMTPLRKLVFP